MKKHETLLVSTILNGTYRGRRFLQMVGMVGLSHSVRFRAYTQKP